MISSQVLGDWNSGKIKYCTHPPEEEKQTSSEIVTQFDSEFSLTELERGEKMDLQNLPLVRPSEMVNVEAGQINDKAADDLIKLAKSWTLYFSDLPAKMSSAHVDTCLMI